MDGTTESRDDSNQNLLLPHVFWSPANYSNSPAQARAMAAEPFPTKFAEPVKSYDAHIYFFQDNPASSASARELREEIIKEFPHLEVYKFWEKPIGPHPTVSLFKAFNAREVERQKLLWCRGVPWTTVPHLGP